LQGAGRADRVATLPIVAGQMPVADRPARHGGGRLGGYDVVMLDTAGRLHIDDELMARDGASVKPPQAARDPAGRRCADRPGRGQRGQGLRAAVGVTGIVLTRIDGDGRGGAALSMRAVTGKPIKLIGTGEKLDALEEFHPDRIAGRILGMGDVVGLVEKAAETIDQEEAEAIAERMQKGSSISTTRRAAQADAEDRRHEGMLGMLPGIGKMKKQIEGANLDDKVFKRQGAIISSMTREERRNPKLLNASRKKRVAAGSGTKCRTSTGC
jgi:signal recognition particle subunit SRP54